MSQIKGRTNRVLSNKLGEEYAYHETTAAED
jgi:hypothetical protein